MTAFGTDKIGQEQPVALRRAPPLFELTSYGIAV
jgi:hypothetical protein